MSRETFHALIAKLTAPLAGRALDASLAAELNERHGRSSPTYRALVDACREGVEQGWMCEREAGGIRYGRVVKAAPATHDFSVDVVEMNDCAGPHHTHPNGEIDLVMPIEGAARFDGDAGPWIVYGPGTAHRPTVSGGRALVLYLLPGGAIQFTRNA